MNIKNIKSLRIFGQRWGVIWVTPDKQERLLDNQIAKSCNYENNIYILNSLSDDKTFEVLLHEAIHVVDEDLRLGLAESAVNRLSIGIASVLLDNFNVNVKEK